MVRRPKYACLLITGVLLGAGPLSGGGGLILQGRVTDVRGKAVPGAELQVIDYGGKLRYRALSDFRGVYRFTVLPEMGANPLPYRLTISHLRFKPPWQSARDARV